MLAKNKAVEMVNISAVFFVQIFSFEKYSTCAIAPLVKKLNADFTDYADIKKGKRMIINEDIAQAVVNYLKSIDLNVGALLNLGREAEFQARANTIKL